MLGLVFIYFIGKMYYELARKFEKNKWLFAIIGLGIFYGATLVFAIVIMLVYEFTGNDSGNLETNIGFNLICSLVGGVFCYFMFKILEKKYEREKLLKMPDSIDNIGVEDTID